MAEPEDFQDMIKPIATAASIVAATFVSPALAQDLIPTTGAPGLTPGVPVTGETADTTLTTAEPEVIEDVLPDFIPELVFTVRTGVEAQPEYFGSDDYRIGPDFSLRLNSITLGNQSYGNPDVTAPPRLLTYGPSFRFISERDPDDFSELAGLDKVDATLEIGATIGVARGNFLAFGEVRRGFGGHEGWVAEAGADVFYRPMDKLVLSAGPRALWGQ